MRTIRTLVVSAVVLLFLGKLGQCDQVVNSPKQLTPGREFTLLTADLAQQLELPRMPVRRKGRRPGRFPVFNRVISVTTPAGRREDHGGAEKGSRGQTTGIPVPFW